MDTDALHGIPGIELAPPADEVDIAVAEALLPVALPPSLFEFMSVSNGARLGQVEIFDLERITTVTNAGEHSWQLPETLIVGAAGPGRALVMTVSRNEVHEVDDNTWDSTTLELAADSPMDLFVRHEGLALRDRQKWWAWPSLGSGLEAGRARLLRDTDSLLEVGIGSNWGQPLAAGLKEFQRVEDARVPEKLGAEEFEDMLLNYRPDPPGPGLSAQVQWAVACNDIALADVRDRIRLAPLSDAVIGQGRWVVDGEFTVADCVRSYAFLALLAQARDDMFAHATGSESTSAVGRLAQVYLAGHVPMGLSAAR